jgi:hypothetical protein
MKMLLKTSFPFELAEVAELELPLPKAKAKTKLKLMQTNKPFFYSCFSKQKRL